MNRDSDTASSVVAHNDGFTVKKQLDTDGFPVPTIIFTICTERDDPAVLRLVDTLPEDFAMEDVGFHPDYESEHWVAYSDYCVEFCRRLKPGEEITTVYGLSLDDYDSVEEFLGTPVVEELVEGRTSTSDVSTMDPFDASHADETWSGFLPRNLRSSPKRGALYLTAGIIVFSLTYFMTLIANVLAGLAIPTFLTRFTTADFSSTAVFGGIALCIALFAAATPYVLAHFTVSFLPYPKGIESPRYELWGIAAAPVAVVTLAALWFPIWSPLAPTLASRLPARITYNLPTFLLTAILTAVTTLVFLNDELETETSSASTPTNPESTTDTDHRDRTKVIENSDTNDTISANEETDAVSQDSDPQTSNETGQKNDFEYDWQDPPTLKFDDVGGMYPVKEELRSQIITPLKGDSEKYEAFGISVPNLLLYGPPGTGKTYLAQALAGELGYPYVKLSAGDILSQWINESGQKVNQLFREAEHIGNRHGHAIVFIDEIDALLADRGLDNQHSENKKVVNEFLNYLEGTTERDTLVIGATNNYDELDKAATRSGRIDKKIHIPLPDQIARIQIFKAQLANRPTRQFDDEDLAKLAQPLDGMNGADIESIVEAAARHTIERDADRITYSDLEWAVQRSVEA